jgi:hypothetical protein
MKEKKSHLLPTVGGRKKKKRWMREKSTHSEKEIYNNLKQVYKKEKENSDSDADRLIAIGFCSL